VVVLGPSPRIDHNFAHSSSHDDDGHHPPPPPTLVSPPPAFLSPLYLQRKRQIEAKIYEVTEEMQEQGFSTEEIERRVKDLRAKLDRTSTAMVVKSDT